MIVRLAILCEGQSEARLIGKSSDGAGLIAPHLWTRRIETQPIILATSRRPDGGAARGGGVNLDRIVDNIRRLKPSFDAVSTLFDLYKFPGADGSADAAEAAIADKVAQLAGSATVIPYVQRWELEALAFGDPDRLAAHLELADARALAAFGAPEEIDGGSETHPFARLDAMARRSRGRGWEKTADIAALAGRLDLGAVRARCPRFSDWLAQLEGLAPSGAA